MNDREPSSASTSRRCTGCGGFLPPDAPEGNCPACLWALASSTADEPPRRETGPRRFGSYQLIEELARGGMGIVWRARQDGLGREVAIKMILAGQLATSAQVLRFYTEARAAARLDHPHIVPIFEIGEDEGCHFYSMRLMEGGSLADLLRGEGTPPQQQAARLVATVARAIHFAHQRGVLHRDVKPSNILLDADGEPYIVDFGLARIAEEDSGASRTHAILGTPGYMAPEQAAGRAREITTAADVYGLGAVLHELLTGKPPFEAETPLKTLRLVAEAAPRPPRALNPAVARDLEVICLKCLQKEPERRYASAAELADDLERWLAGKPIRARPVSLLERLASWARRKPELASALAALCAILAVALAVSLALFVQVRRQSEARAVALRSEESQRLAFQSLAVARDNPGQALLLALEAAARAPSLSAQNALLSSLEACRERRRFLGHGGSVDFAAFSPGGERVVTASTDATARIWDVETGDPVRVLKGHQGWVTTAVFSPDGTRVLTAGRDATARIWDAGDGRELMALSAQGHEVREAGYSPAGDLVLTVGRDAAHLWDAASGRMLRVLSFEGGEVSHARFSPGGRQVVASGMTGTARVWDVDTGGVLANLAGPARLLGICFSKDGSRIAAASQEGTAVVWQASTGRELRVLRGHGHVIYSLALTSDGEHLATGSEDFTARVWETATGRELHVLPHGHKVISVDLSPDDAFLATASYDKVARVWELRSGQLIAEMRGHAAPLNHVAFSPDSRHVVSSSVDFTARLWTVDTPDPLVLAANVSVMSADLAPGGASYVHVGEGERTASIRDLPSRRELARLEGHGDGIRLVRFSADGAQVLTGCKDGSVRLWDARTGKPLLVLTGHTAVVNLGCFSPDGRWILTAANDQTARAWDASSGAAMAVFRMAADLRSICFSADSRLVALADQDWNLRICDLSSGKEQPLREQLGPITSADFGAENHRLVTTSLTTRAHVLTWPDGRIEATLVHPARAMYAAYSPDKRWIVTAASDWILRLWDAATHEERLEIRKPEYLPILVHFAAGRVVVNWILEKQREAWHGAALAYPLPLDVLAAARKARFGDLTPDEREHFQVGSPEERRAHRQAWRGGHIYGPDRAAER
jgi:WD40 repeat protein